MTFILAIDGPAGAGKSTVSRLVAQRLGFALVDTGAIYRCVALLAVERGIDWTADSVLGSLARSMRIDFDLQAGVNRVRLFDRDVSDLIRTPEISRAASVVSARPSVRAGLLDLQRRLAREVSGGAVLEGRDIGTVVFPEADAKVFLTASPEVRARRRLEELLQRGAFVSFDEVLADQLARDREDETRAIAPLKPAPDAVRVDSTGLPAEAVVDRIVEIVARIRRPSDPA